MDDSVCLQAARAARVADEKEACSAIAHQFTRGRAEEGQTVEGLSAALRLLRAGRAERILLYDDPSLIRVLWSSPAACWLPATTLSSSTGT